MSQFGSSQFGSSQFSVLETVNVAIESSDIIPKDAQKAIKDFLRDSFESFWSNIEDILNLDPPIELLEHWNSVLELVRSLLQST